MTFHSTHEVADAIGVTFRTLDHWGRRGYIEVPGYGRGHNRIMTMAQATRAANIAALVRAGVAPSVAATVAPESPRVTGPVTITLDTEAVQAALLERLGR